MRIALAQLRPMLADKAANLTRAEQAIAEAAASGAQLVLFPELFLTGYFTRKHTRELAEPLGGPSIGALAQSARRHGAAVMMGFAELHSDSMSVYDSACVVGADGRLLGSYRKTHLYDEEKKYFRAGTRYTTVDLGPCRAGLMICYDLEFPEVTRILALDGARLMLVSTANMTPFETYQDVYIRARAMENHVFVAVANRVGDEEQTHFFGQSAVCDPMGRLCVRGGGEEGLLFADVDLRLIEASQQTLAYLTNRRPDSYGPLAEDRRLPRR